MIAIQEGRYDFYVLYLYQNENENLTISSTPFCLLTFLIRRFVKAGIP